MPPRGKPHDWQPARWGSTHAEAFTEVEMEVRAGDRLQFTRNNYRAGRLNGHTAEVVAVDAAGSSVVVAREDGRREMLDMAHLADRHVRHGSDDPLGTGRQRRPSDGQPGELPR